MTLQRTHIVALVALSILLFAAQAGIYWSTFRPYHNETQKQNAMARHKPTELLGLTGFAVLLGAAGLLIYKRPYTDRSAADESLR
jgi:hypothetical protein